MELAVKLLRETIYSIKIHEAFQEDTECPFCPLEEEAEEKYVDYLLNQALMDVRTRGETNREGFCRRHLELLYNRRGNRLQLALLLDTHLAERNKRLQELCAFSGVAAGTTVGSGLSSRWKNRLWRGKETEVYNRLVQELHAQEKSCFLCRKMNEAMVHYLKVTLYLWEKEKAFAALFAEKKGFCHKHLRQLLEAAVQNLPSRKRRIFIPLLLEQQLANMKRLQGEVHRFTEKMSYHQENLPWGTARDALIRGIRKLAGYCRLE